LLAGPVFGREVVTVPRRTRLYVSRATYVTILFLLTCTAYALVTGTQMIRNVSQQAYFGAVLFQILAPLQLAWAMIFSALIAAGGVSQEKDRRTLVLLLLTNLSNSELVLGKLLASLLSVFVMLAAALPMFLFSTLFGGVAFEQIGRVFAVTLASALVAGSLASTVAYWRETTFQALAWTALALVFWLAGWELVAAGAFGEHLFGVPATAISAWMNPAQAISVAMDPVVRGGFTLAGEPISARSIDPVMVFLGVALVASVILNGIAVVMVRVWNPSRQIRRQTREGEHNASIWGAEHDLRARAKVGRGTAENAENRAETASEKETEKSVHAAPGSTREVWDNPILWREMCTWAYGRKVLVIRIGYLLLFALAAFIAHRLAEGINSGSLSAGLVIPVVSQPLVPLFVLSLVLMNAMAVTSLTTERDGRALDLLLVTDLSPKEIIFGKLGGVLYNTKEMILLPMLLCIYLWYVGWHPVQNRLISGEHLLYLLLGLAVLNIFGAMLGIHVGMTYNNSRSAIATSLGTVLFLIVGIATCMRMMVAFSGSFQGQLQPFLAFMLGGGVGLYVALGMRNPSPAIAVASFGAPLATFYAITSFLQGQMLAALLATAITYGFATAAMLIPAIYEFDVATGRTSADHEEG